MKPLNVYKPYLNYKEISAVSKVLKSGWLTNGKTMYTCHTLWWITM